MKEDTSLLLAIFVSMGYNMLCMANAPVIGGKYYILLLSNARFFYSNLLLTLLVAVAGVWWAKSHHTPNGVLYAAPFMFLLLLRLLNYIIVKLYGRYVLLLTRYDSAPSDPEFKVKALDRIAFLLLLWAPFVMALLLVKLL